MVRLMLIAFLASAPALAAFGFYLMAREEMEK